MTCSNLIDQKPQECEHLNTEMGYGLAGGGIGVYEWCNDCQRVIKKTQDAECIG